MQWRYAAATAVIVLVAVAAVVVNTDMADRAVDELLASHGRATVGQRMIDVASSELHTVKPWLSARLPYSPPVADLASQGFPLTGGRIDYIGGKPVAVLVYGRRQHTVEVFVWPEDQRSARTLTRAGLNLESFSTDGMRYWLVSDVSTEDLRALARLLGRS
jgi:anti-sigma factor RsiW